MEHQPITSKDFGRGKPRRTICQVHREIYHLLNKNEANEADKKRMLDLIQEAYDYGIRMSRKLHEYAGKEWVSEVFF